MENSKEEYEVSKLPVDLDKLDRLPVWFGHILYNKMMPKGDIPRDVKHNPRLGGHHFYAPRDKPISTLIDFSKIERDAIEN